MAQEVLLADAPRLLPRDCSVTMDVRTMALFLSVAFTCFDVTTSSLPAAVSRTDYIGGISPFPDFSMGVHTLEGNMSDVLTFT